MRFKIKDQKLADEIEWFLSINNYGELVLLGNGKKVLGLTRSGGILDYTKGDMIPILGHIDLTQISE